MCEWPKTPCLSLSRNKWFKTFYQKNKSLLSLFTVYKRAVTTTLFKHSYFVYLIHSKWLQTTSLSTVQECLGKVPVCLPGIQAAPWHPSTSRALAHSSSPACAVPGADTSSLPLFAEAMRWRKPCRTRHSSHCLPSSVHLWRSQAKPTEDHYGSGR